MRQLVIGAAIASMLASCTATSSTFYRNPSRVDLAQMCRAYLADTATESYRRDLASEMLRRGEDPNSCQAVVDQRNAIIATMMVIAGVTAVGIIACANNACPSGGAPPTPREPGLDIDCYPGPGNGPRYVQGPVVVDVFDTYDLDRDGDGIGCEAFGDFGA